MSKRMAIAAGVKPPRVMLLDGPVVNAAALGSSYDDAVVLVSRRLLDELDRDETQAVVAHLIGAVGNGDLRVALSMLSLFRTIALLMTALGATLGPAARRTLLRMMRLALRQAGTGSHGDEAASVDELLAEVHGHERWGSRPTLHEENHRSRRAPRSAADGALRHLDVPARLRVVRCGPTPRPGLADPALPGGRHRGAAHAESGRALRARSRPCRRRAASFQARAGPPRSSSSALAPGGPDPSGRPGRRAGSWATTSAC